MKGSVLRKTRSRPELCPAPDIARETLLINTVSNPNDPTCAQTATNTLTPAQIATLDAACLANGVCTTPGPNAAVLAFFQQYPLPNGATEGDGYNLLSYTFSSPLSWFAEHQHSQARLRDQRQASSVRARKPAEGHAVRASKIFPAIRRHRRLRDNSKGIAAGETWSITPHIVNDVRYGFIRQGYQQSRYRPGRLHHLSLHQRRRARSLLHNALIGGQRPGQQRRR